MGYVTLFAIFCLCINWILKMTVQVCYFRLYFFRHGNRFLSSVSTNGKDVRGLKLSFDVACVASVSVASVSFPPRQWLVLLLRRFILQGEVLVSHDEIVTCCVDQERANVCKSESPLKLCFQQSSFVCKARLSPGQT